MRMMRPGMVMIVLASVVLGTISRPLYAQRQIESEIELSRAVIETQRQALVAHSMILTGEEGRQFWPVYKEYRADVDEVGARVVTLIRDYAENHMTLSNEQAKALLDEYLSIEKAKLRLKTKYVKKFRKALPDTQVRRYFQIENRLDAIVFVDLASQIPLAWPK